MGTSYVLYRDLECDTYVPQFPNTNTHGLNVLARLLCLRHWTSSKASSKAGSCSKKCPSQQALILDVNGCSGKEEAAPEPAQHCSVQVLGFAELKEERPGKAKVPKREPQRRLRVERVKGLGGRKVRKGSCRTCPQGGLSSINNGSHCSFAGL